MINQSNLMMASLKKQLKVMQKPLISNNVWLHGTLQGAFLMNWK